MQRRFSFEGIESAPRWIVLFLGGNLLVHLFVLYVWNAAGQVFSIQGTSGSTNALSVSGMAGVDLWLCLVVLRSFPAGAPLRPAWILMASAAAAEGASGVLSQILGTGWILNPLTWTGRAGFGWMERVRVLTVIAAGPGRLVLLAGAVWIALRTLRKFGFGVRPHTTDWAVCGVVCLFAVCRLVEAGAAFLAGQPIRPDEMASLAGLPVLCVLVLEAMLLRRSIGRMGNGLIAKGWMALVYGIFLTGLGEMALWVVPHFSRTLTPAILSTLIRLATAAAFALVPAFQVAAQRRAIQPIDNQSEDLPTGIPVLAR